MARERYSAQREKIFEAVAADRTHPTAEAVYEELKPLMPRLSLGTVYRNLNRMAEGGKLVKLDGTTVRFDATVSPHSHLRCTCCDRVLDLPVPYDRHLDRTAEACGCAVERHSLLFFGICPDCCKKTTQSSTVQKRQEFHTI